MNKIKTYIKYGSITLFWILFFIGIWKLSSFKRNTKERKLFLLIWSGSFDRETIQNFEEKTGIKVYVSYYFTNEELISKLLLSKDSDDIDIVMPSDYAIKILTEQKLLKKLNKSMLPFDKIYPRLLEDVSNDKYAIPLEWSIYGICTNNKYSHLDTEDIYDRFFMPSAFNENNMRICMSNDSVAACGSVILYNFHKLNPSVEDKVLLKTCFETLKKQRPYVKVYADSRVSNLFETQAIDTALVQSDEYLRMIKQSDSDLTFYISSYGAIKTVEYLGIFKESKHEKEAYEFFDYIFSKDVMKKNVESLCALPARSDLESTLNIPKQAKFFFDLIKCPQIPLYSLLTIFSEEERVILWSKLKAF